MQVYLLAPQGRNQSRQDDAYLGQSSLAYSEQFVAKQFHPALFVLCLDKMEFMTT